MTEPTTPAEVLSIEGTVRHMLQGRDSPNGMPCRCCEGPHVFGASIDGIEGSGTGWLFQQALWLPEGTRVRLTLLAGSADHD